MVPHSWLIKCLNLLRAADNISVLINNSISTWKTELTAAENFLGEVNINLEGNLPVKQSIASSFLRVVDPSDLRKCSLEKERDLLTMHQLYIHDLKLYGIKENHKDSLVQLVRVIITDICKDFGTNKCTILILKRRKIVQTEGIDLLVKGKIRSLDEDNKGFKYLGIIEVDYIKHTEMKEIVGKEY